jgi:hypothetical protein
MLQVTPHMRILVCIQPIDFRKGIDGIAAVCPSYMRIRMVHLERLRNRNRVPE